MRIWDVNPGYLARQQLLGEHRELHGLFNVITIGKKGYAKHPETLRWVGCISALSIRHRQLTAEMQLRGYNHHSPLPDIAGAAAWPSNFIDAPARQFELLAGKYAADGRSGRIPLPRNCQELWAQHKYSVMAHDPNLYRELGPAVAHGGQYHDNTDALSLLLIRTLRSEPEAGHLMNALQHMWGYVKGDASPPQTPSALLEAIQTAAIKYDTTYLINSTALSELALWL